MDSQPLLAFDVDALRKLAGTATFGRGDACHRAGRVTIVGINPNRVRARVEGTETYRTSLAGKGAYIRGECSCRAFAERGFCKHLVATALAVNAGEGHFEPEGIRTLARIRQHLAAKSIDQLVELIVDLAEQDDGLLRKLELESAHHGVTSRDLEARLRKAIDRATAEPNDADYRGASTWAAGVATVLDALSELAEGEHSDLVRHLAERAIERIEDALQWIDDSGGHCSGLLERAMEVHLAAVRMARPDPIVLARDLFFRETHSDFGVFARASFTYGDALGEAGQAEYRRLATDAWDKLSAPQAGSDEDEADYDPRTVMLILDGFAAREGDVATRIALRSRLLTSASSYAHLAMFCVENGKEDDALNFAEEGLFLHEDDPDESLVLVAAELLEKAGRKDDAVARLWSAFDKRPSARLYRELRRHSGVAARDRAIRRLEARAGKSGRTYWEMPAELLIEILIEEAMFDAAWAAARTHGASPPLLERLARASEVTHAGHAIGVYSERVEAIAGSGNTASYAEAAALISHMASLRGVAEHATYLADIKARHGRKRNLMALLR